MALSAMGWRAGCAVVAMSVGMVSAQAAVAATVKGRVVDAATNRPLPGAAIKLATGAAATTDTDGSFAIDGVADGPQQLTVDYVGYATKTVDVTAGPDAQPLQIALESHATGDIVVTGTRAAERVALQAKKAADNFVEALYANDVGKLPDQNVAEAVQRLPGLTVANDQGEGRYVIIRGIDPNLINVTLNGQTLPAPEPDGRQVKLDDIPSSLISAVVVTKSLTPDLDANAIGGSVDIRTVTAFDRNKKFFFDARGAIGRYDINHKKPYELDAQVGGLFGANKQFGAVFSVNYSRRPIESQNFQASEAYVVPDASTGANQSYIVPDQNGLRDYNLIRTRLGIVGNLDWQPSSDTHVYLHTSYSKFTDDENRDQNRLADEDNFSNQTATSGTFDAVGTILVRHREEDDNTKSATLGGEFNLGAGKLEASGGYTKAIKTDPLRSEFTFATNKGGAPGTPITVDYDLTTGPYTFDDRDDVFSDASRFGISKFNLERRRAYEELWQGRVDYSVPIAVGTDSSIKIGAKYLDRHKFNDQNKTDYKAGKEDWLLSQGDISHIGNTNFYDGMFRIGQRIDYFAAYDYTQDHPDVLKVDADGTLADTLSPDYDVHESIIAGYAMATLKFGGLTLIPGVRVEQTKDSDKAKLVTDTSTLDDDYNSFGKKKYTDWFPGLNAKYEINKSLFLRAAATTSIGRPNYAMLAPFVLVEDDTVPNISLGNPNLDPYKAVNLDASVEYYLPSQGILSVGLFYKHIDNPIYTQVVRVTDGNYGGQSFPTADVSQPFNAKDEVVKGIELNAQVQFTFLPSPLDGFGASANYTHVSGHADAPEIRTGDVPLFFQSKNIANAQLSYEKYGFSARIAYSFRSHYLDLLGSDPRTDEYTDDHGELDVHASYQFSPAFTIFGDATNLTDAPWRRYIGTKNQLVERERYGPLFRVGVQIHF